MKALSIRQPWAWLICDGIKDVENRSWPTDVRSRIYVHAGAKVDRSAIPVRDRRIYGGPDYTIARETAIKMCTEAISGWKAGAIIGEVDIVGCKFGVGYDALHSEWHELGMYGYILANPVLYDEPIPCKGKLGFFEPGIALEEGQR